MLCFATLCSFFFFFFFSSRRRHTRWTGDWSSDVCSSDLSLGVYGIVLAGWSSNNKYSLLGGLRASAQMISYEIAMGMSTVAVLLLAQNVTLTEVIARQSSSLFTWNVFPLSLAFFIFVVAAFAETNRLPFDLPEAEAELIAGYHTEYSAMKFSMFYIAEYSNMVTASALMA